MNLEQQATHLEMTGALETRAGVRISRSAGPDGMTRWRLSWYDAQPDGSKRRRQTWASGSARDAIDKARNARGGGNHRRASTTSGVTLKELRKRWLDSATPRSWAATHREQRKLQLSKALDGHESTPAAALTSTEVADMVAGGRTADSQYRRRDALRELLDWGHRHGHLPHSREELMARVDLPRRPPPRGGRIKTPTLTSFYSVLTAAEAFAKRKWGEEAGDEVIAFFLMLLMTGMRPGEAMALRVRDVDLVQRRVTVRSTLAEPIDGRLLIKPPKSGRTRMISYPALSFSPVADMGSLGIPMSTLRAGGAEAIGIYAVDQRFIDHAVRVRAKHGPNALMFGRLMAAKPRKPQLVEGIDSDPIPPGQRFWTRGPLSSALWRPVRDLVPEWKSEQFTPYSLRHLYATHRLNTLHHPVAAVAASMGHSTVDVVLRRYVAAPEIPPSEVAWLPPGATPIPGGE